MLNQFAQSVKTGMVDPTIQNQVYTCQAGEEIEAGEAVYLASDAGHVPVVKKATGAEAPFGVAILNPMREVTKAKGLLEIAAAGSSIYIKAAGAVVRGELLTYAADGTYKVVTDEATERIFGRALDNGADGSIIRMIVADQQFGY